MTRDNETRMYIEHGNIVERVRRGSQFCSGGTQYVPKYEQELLKEERRRAMKYARRNDDSGILFDKY